MALKHSAYPVFKFAQVCSPPSFRRNLEMRQMLLISIQPQTSSTITALVCFHGNLPDGGAINEKREKKRPL